MAANKSRSAAFYPSFYAGDPAHPSPPAPPPRTRTTGMWPRQRLTSAMAAAAPVQQLTPDQQWFRATAEGRWSADPSLGAHAPAYGMRRHPDGTTDVVRLEPNGADWLDMGGRGGRDVAGGRPS